MRTEREILLTQAKSVRNQCIQIRDILSDSIVRITNYALSTNYDRTCEVEIILDSLIKRLEEDSNGELGNQVDHRQQSQGTDLDTVSHRGSTLDHGGPESD